MKIRALLITSVIPTLLLSSCATTQIPKDEMTQRAKQQINVVESPGTKSQIRIIGTTVFNNKFQEIDDPELSITTVLVEKLRQRGYNAKATWKEEGLFIKPFPTSPYMEDYMKGSGIYQRSFAGIKNKIMVHSNYLAGLDEKDSGRRNSTSLSDANASYHLKQTDRKESLTDWDNLPPDVRASLKEELRSIIEANADTIIEGLGL